MNLTLLTNGSCDNPKLWSGTPMRLREEFRVQMGTPVNTVNYALPRWWKSITARLFQRQEFVIGSTRDPWYRFWVERKVRRILASRESNGYFFFVCDHNCPPVRRGTEKFAVYVDSVVEEYLKHLVGKTWWRRKYEDYLLKYEKLSLSKADLIFTQNEWSRQFYIQQWQIPENRVFNVGFGVNLKPYGGEKDYSLEELLIVLRRGTEHYKGLDLLLDAFKLLHQRRPEVKLNVVGTTGETLEGVTFWEGYPREKTVELFQRATLYVMPALREPNGITYLEGLANRAPIVGLNRFAVPEFSGYGKWGFICEHEDPRELADVLENALSDKKRLVSMGLEGQKFVTERYDWTKVVRKMIDIMEAHP